MRLPGRHRLARIALLLLAAVLVLYAGDYFSLRYRLPGNRDPFGTVEIHRYYALHKSRDKTNFLFAEPETQVCVHSLFPHLGHLPCWYLSRRTEQRIDYE